MDEGSQAKKYGVRPGWVILEVAGTHVTTRQGSIDAVSAAKTAGVPFDMMFRKCGDRVWKVLKVFQPEYESTEY